ncbi:MULTISPECIES: hypothetical protein [Pseudomonas]|uniref:hypothetical protein n=1 Tax=Pseudomonas TaxID=286 RepID=UPI00224962FA|nr:hypothetical protein [Pseudomonas sp. DCB_BG]MCX2706238.1 hypothetical protein [Pseudomonas sp. DCB_BG]
MAEFRQLRNYFDKAPNDGITPAHMAKYRDVRANREIAKALRVKQKKPHKKLRPLLEVNDVERSLGTLIRKIQERNAPHGSPYLLMTDNGKRVTSTMPACFSATTRATLPRGFTDASGRSPNRPNKQIIRTRPNSITSRAFPRVFPWVDFLGPKNAKSPE